MLGPSSDGVAASTNMTAAAHPRISYDTVPYPTFAQRQTHPDRFAVHATLFTGTRRSTN
jgi:hypothetical protein